MCANEVRGPVTGMPGVAKKGGERVEDILAVLKINNRMPAAANQPITRGQPDDDIPVIAQAALIKAAVQTERRVVFTRARHSAACQRRHPPKPSGFCGWNPRSAPFFRARREPTHAERGFHHRSGVDPAR
jgi:hypothetical protein